MARLVRERPVFDPREFGAKCAECPIENPTPVGYEMRAGALLNVVCESPGRVELITGRPLTGPTGNWFNYVCRLRNIPREKLNILNAACCPFPKFFQWKKRGQMVECCKPVLEHHLLGAKPRTVLACGQGACRAMVREHRVKRLVGSWVKGVEAFSEFDVLPNFHPTFAGLRERTLRVHFITWLSRAWTAAQNGVPTWSWSKHTWGGNAASAAALRRLIDRGRPLAVDVESVGPNPVKCQVTWVGLGDGEEAVSIPLEKARSSHYSNSKALVEYGQLGTELYRLVVEALQKAPYLITQNGSHDVLALKRFLEVSNGFDTLRAFSAAAPQTQGYQSLEDLLVLELDGAPRWKTQHRDARTRTEDEVAEYNCCDVDATAWLEGPIRRRLAKTFRGEEVYHRLMLQDRVATKSRERGCLVAIPRVREHFKKLKSRAYEETRCLRRVAARYDMFNFNPESAPQRSKLFFEKLNAKPTAYSELTGEPSLNDKALAKLMSDDNPEVRNVALHMRRYRGYSQLRKILQSIKPDTDHVLRPEPNVDGTVGERWSYQKPNIQTIPKPKLERLPDGKTRVLAAGLRDIFIARPRSWIVELDYDRLELYVVGILSDDPIIKRWMVTPGVDAHRENALALFGVCEGNLRDLAKRLVYNINYGNTNLERLAKGAYEVLKADFPKITFPQVLRHVQRWFEVHYWIADWRARTLEQAKENGYTEEEVSGRRRYWYGEPKDTEVYNFKIQTLAGHLTARAIIEVDKHLDWGKEGMLFQCHDSIVLEGPDPVRLYEIAKTAMEAPITILGETYRFPVGVKVGKDWGNAKEYAGADEIRQMMLSSH